MLHSPRISSLARVTAMEVILIDDGSTDDTARAARLSCGGSRSRSSLTKRTADIIIKLRDAGARIEAFPSTLDWTKRRGKSRRIDLAGWAGVM